MTTRTLGRRRLLAMVAGLIGCSVARPGAAAAVDDLDTPPGLPAVDDEAASDEIEAAPVAGPASASYGVPPTSLVIPRLGVEAITVGVGQDEEGAMDVPPDPDQVAWYALGPGMGVPGNAVFAAHVDWGGRPRVFGRLSALGPGDAILVVDGEGNVYEYLVESSRLVRAEGAPIDEIFGQGDEAVITLITCGGAYDPATREYLDRLIVRAKGG